jgi:glycosyltransferase involved in cell wall biosynthesis
MTFSVIIPIYNRAHLISKAISSVINQKYSKWELIIIDDGSTDNIQEVVTSYNNDRIKYIYQENAERSVARNNGIKNAKGDWICFLDSDDYFLPNHLEVFAKYISEKSLSPSFLVTGGYDEKNGELFEKPIFHKDLGLHPSYFILEKTTITPISVCIHRDCFNNHLFIEAFKKSYWEDTHLWIRLAIDFPFYQLPEFTNVLAEHKERSVNSKITIKRVSDHISMIYHLPKNYPKLIEQVFTKEDFRKYTDRKFRMFLYQARQSKQLYIALWIWYKGFSNKPSFYLITEFPKIFINKMRIGLHGK